MRREPSPVPMPKSWGILKRRMGVRYSSMRLENWVSLQYKLLRVLEEKEVFRLGSNIPHKVNVRIIVATKANLKEEVRKGSFSEDLYFWLLGFSIEWPPLRARGNDVLILSKFFAEAFCKENRLKKVRISPAAQKNLKKYHWPGNVRS